MQAIQNWCYTIFAGVLFSGIVLLLTPSERFRPLMQLLLGAFCWFVFLLGAVGLISNWR